MCRKALNLDYLAIALVLVFFIKIGLLKARRRRAFKRPIFVFSAPKALKIQKSVSYFKRDAARCAASLLV
jgi:hypothetical protein